MNKFDKKTNRRGTNSFKWDVGENELPMWVADMDFQTAPAIIDALKERVEHGIFGYTDIPDEWYESIINWWSTRHNYTMEKEWLMFVTGVVPAISSIVRSVTNVAENVVVMSPTYNIFYNSIYNNGRNILQNELIYKDNEYSIDYVGLEKNLANPQTSLLILCNPHNPIGKIWKYEELEKIGELCAKHNVTVISDEIHCDITVPGHNYIPFASVNEVCKNISITCIAPTKAFNIAGTKTAAISVPNNVLRNRVNRGINTDEVAEPNVFAVTAAITAFTEGEEWLDELREYIAKNKVYTENYINTKIPCLKAVSEKATYLEWIDCSELVEDSAELAEFIRKETGLYVSKGEQYRGNGQAFLRLNMACQFEVLKDGLDRLKRGVELYINREQ